MCTSKLNVLHLQSGCPVVDVFREQCSLVSRISVRHITAIVLQPSLRTPCLGETWVQYSAVLIVLVSEQTNIF